MVGGNSGEFRRHCVEIVKLHKPAMLVLLETRMAKHKHLIRELGFSGQIQNPVVSLSGGDIVIMWKDDILKTDEVSTTP